MFSFSFSLSFSSNQGLETRNIVVVNNQLKSKLVTDRVQLDENNCFFVVVAFFSSPQIRPVIDSFRVISSLRLKYRLKLVISVSFVLNSYSLQITAWQKPIKTQRSFNIWFDTSDRFQWELQIDYLRNRKFCIPVKCRRRLRRPMCHFHDTLLSALDEFQITGGGGLRLHRLETNKSGYLGPPSN